MPMSKFKSKLQSKPKSKLKSSPIYIASILQTKISVKIVNIRESILETLASKLLDMVGNKCIEDGYISSHNIHILIHSEGTIHFDEIVYHLTYRCNIAQPVDGMVFKAKVKTITKAGIHSQVFDDYGHVPMTVYILNDQNCPNALFHAVKDTDHILIKVITTRYELLDSSISVIANLLQVVD
jgi:DNA-directed RNA polymerase subunit E'/Rpb7